VGRPAVRCGGAAGGIDGRGFHPSFAAGRLAESGAGFADLAARAPLSAGGGLVGAALPCAEAEDDVAVAADESGLAGADAPPLPGSSGCSARTRPSR